MSKVSRSFFAAAVAHKEMPGAYMASFAMAGEPPQWITQGGKPQMFDSAIEAELAGMRILLKKLNNAYHVQEFKSRPTDMPHPKKKESIRSFRSKGVEEHKAEVKSVFKKFT